MSVNHFWSHTHCFHSVPPPAAAPASRGRTQRALPSSVSQRRVCFLIKNLSNYEWSLDVAVKLKYLLKWKGNLPPGLGAWLEKPIWVEREVWRIFLFTNKNPFSLGTQPTEQRFLKWWCRFKIMAHWSNTFKTLLVCACYLTCLKTGTRVASTAPWLAALFCWFRFPAYNLQAFVKHYAFIY